MTDMTHAVEDDADPYDEPIFIRSRIPRLSHMHSEPICAFPECETYLTREDMAAMRQGREYVRCLTEEA